MNELMLLQSNWKRVVFTPDIGENEEMWNEFCESERPNVNTHSLFVVNHVRAEYNNEEWSNMCFNEQSFDIYILCKDAHSMFIEQFIEEELSDAFYWKWSIQEGALEKPREEAWPNYYYEGEDNEIIQLDQRDTLLIAGAA